jgi:hypothetical protein
MRAVHEPGVRPSGGGWRSRWRGRVDVDPQLPALLGRILERLGRYLDQGGPDAPTWVTDMTALERQLAYLAAGTRDRPLHFLLRELLRQMSAVYACAPGVGVQAHRAAFGALFDAMETAEELAQKALDRAAEIQPVTVGNRIPA